MGNRRVLASSPIDEPLTTLNGVEWGVDGIVLLVGVTYAFSYVFIEVGCSYRIIDTTLPLNIGRQIHNGPPLNIGRQIHNDLPSNIGRQIHNGVLVVCIRTLAGC